MSKKKTKVKTAKKKTQSATPAVKKQNPEFEGALEQEARAAEIRKQKEAEKAGRTEIDDYIDPEKSRGGESVPDVSTVPLNAKKAIAPFLKIPFGIWANIEDIKEIRLSTEEAQEWAEPIVAILEYYYPDKVPEVVWIWLMLLTATGHVIDSRIDIKHRIKEGSAAPQVAGQGPAQESPGSTSKEPAHNGAEPGTGFPKLVDIAV